MSPIAVLAIVIGFSQAYAQSNSAVPAQAESTSAYNYLVKLAPNATMSQLASLTGNKKVLSNLGGRWVAVTLNAEQASPEKLQKLLATRMVVSVQPNYAVHLLNDFKVNDPVKRAQLERYMAFEMAKGNPFGGDDAVPADNPAIPAVGTGLTGSGADPEFHNQWGMNDVGVTRAWQKSKGTPDTIVAVIDTGVDYTHEDLVGNMWHNAGETGVDASGHDKSNNNIDDDNNGFVDDVIGWDFASNDNKPYDLTVDRMAMLFGGGNPGHGTHCSGNVGARAENGKGIAGVAPNVKIMPIRFLNEKGQGDSAGAIRAIRYAVDNGAKVLSNSWGSEGEDSDKSTNQALKDAIEYARSKGVLFIAAAGNGHNGVGYDNDNDPKPGYPASYSFDNIISVAAIDKNNALGAFSNWGAKTVHIGAPGVSVYSTVPGNKYEEKVIDIDALDLHVTWDGTSMATPHVAGAAGLYWSLNPKKSYQEVRAAILQSATPISALSGKSVSGGKLNVAELVNR